MFARALRGLAATKLTKPGTFRTADGDGEGHALRCSYKARACASNPALKGLPQTAAAGRRAHKACWTRWSAARRSGRWRTVRLRPCVSTLRCAAASPLRARQLAGRCGARNLLQ